MTGLERIADEIRSIYSHLAIASALLAILGLQIQIAEAVGYTLTSADMTIMLIAGGMLGIYGLSTCVKGVYTITREWRAIDWNRGESA